MGLDRACSFCPENTSPSCILILNMKGNITVVGFLFILSLHTTRGYIVDTDNGNDNNNGETINDPFKTITRCVEALANPGDECLIRAGTYHEVVTVSGLQGKKYLNLDMSSIYIA